MTDRTVTIQVQGAPEDQGHIRVSEFIQELEAVKTALRHTERMVSGSEEPVLTYRIVDVKRTNPFTLVIEAVPMAQKKDVSFEDFSQATVGKFFDNMRQLKGKQVPKDADLATLQAYKSLTDVLEKHISEVVIRNTQDQIVLDREFRAVIDTYIGPDELAEGSIAGVLEKVNLHGTHVFNIYPTVGPKQVVCDFPPDLRKKVKEALDNYVRVFGTLRYKWLSPFPHAVTVRDIEIFPPEDQLPTIFDLRGIAPDATDGLTAEEFIAKIRGEATG